MGQCDTRQLLRNVGENADHRAGRLEPAHRAADVGVAPEVDGRALLGEALEPCTPVRQLLVERIDVDPETAAGILEPVAEERLGVADCGEVDRHGLHCSRTFNQTIMPMHRPIASMATSTGAACRPRTKCWWNSSLAAYAIPAARAGASRSNARSNSMP